jgi:hypothetical protein
MHGTPSRLMSMSSHVCDQEIQIPEKSKRQSIIDYVAPTLQIEDVFGV